MAKVNPWGGTKKEQNVSHSGNRLLAFMEWNRDQFGKGTYRIFTGCVTLLYTYPEHDKIKLFNILSCLYLPLYLGR